MLLYFIGNREKRSVREPKALSVLKQMEMGRCFNTLKNNLIYQHYYHTEYELYTAVEECQVIYFYTIFLKIQAFSSALLVGKSRIL